VIKTDSKQNKNTQNQNSRTETDQKKGQEIK
jgi:hypothetical protein